MPFEALELDLASDGPKIQEKLLELTGQRSVPNIFIGGTHVGGCDDMKAKVSSGVVKQLLDDNGI